MGEKPLDNICRQSNVTMPQVSISISFPPSQLFPEDVLALVLLTLRSTARLFIVIIFSTNTPYSTTSPTSKPTALPTTSKKPSAGQPINRFVLKLLATPPTIPNYLRFDATTNVTTTTTTVMYTTITRSSIVIHFTAVIITAAPTIAATVNTITNTPTAAAAEYTTTACLFNVIPFAAAEVTATAAAVTYTSVYPCIFVQFTANNVTPINVTTTADHSAYDVVSFFSVMPR